MDLKSAAAGSMLDLEGVGSKERLLAFQGMLQYTPNQCRKFVLLTNVFKLYEKPLLDKCHFKALPFLSPDAEVHIYSLYNTREIAPVPLVVILPHGSFCQS